jgi:hypothetical protein
MARSNRHQPDFTVEQTDDGIHVLTFHKPSPTAINEMADHMVNAAKAARNALAEGSIPVILAITDISESGMPSIRFISQRFRKLKSQLPTDVYLRNVFIHRPGAMISMMSVIVDLLMNGEAAMKKAKLFPVEQRDEAIAWLQQEKEAILQTYAVVRN